MIAGMIVGAALIVVGILIGLLIAAINSDDIDQ